MSKWTKVNNMQLNPVKTKELFLCFSKQPVIPPEVNIDGVNIDKTEHTKSLGIYMSTDLKWQMQVDAMYTRTLKKLYTLTMLSKAGFSKTDLVEVYARKICTTLEYTSPLWYLGLHKISIIP